MSIKEGKLELEKCFQNVKAGMGMFGLLPKIYETCIKANSTINIPNLQLHFPMSFLGIFVKTFLDFIFLPIRLGMLHFILHEDIVLH